MRNDTVVLESRNLRPVSCHLSLHMRHPHVTYLCQSLKCFSTHCFFLTFGQVLTKAQSYWLILRPKHPTGDNVLAITLDTFSSYNF